jgi:radical SAM protein with 4Fe4S-binding SPASM domain
MSDLLLERPVRLQVDLLPPPGAPGEGRGASWLRQPGAGAATAALEGAGLFFVTLAHPRGDLLGDAAALARGLTARGVRVSLVLEDPGLIPPLGPQPPFGEILLDVTGDDREERVAAFAGNLPPAGPGRPRGGLLLRPGRGMGRALGSLARLALDHGLTLLELPPLPLVYHGREAARSLVPLPEDYQAARVALAAAGPWRDPRLEARIHDILLSALLREIRGGAAGAPHRFTGCQAAGALGHVRADGLVFPCAMLPVALGRVEELADPDFWRRPATANLRRELSLPPPACHVCRAWEACHGGCPGAREALTGRCWGEDPLCLPFRDLAAEKARP